MDAKEIAERIIELNQQCIDWNLAPVEGATECLKQSARYMEVAKLAPALAAAYLAEREERAAILAEHLAVYAKLTCLHDAGYTTRPFKEAGKPERLVVDILPNSPASEEARRTAAVVNENIRLCGRVAELEGVLARQCDSWEFFQAAKAALAGQQKVAEQPTIIEGQQYTCEKVPHGDSGMLHGPDDDEPYYMDGVTYCGRCHRYLGPMNSHKVQQQGGA